MNNYNILITGAAGFIGSHVIRLMVHKYPNYNFVNLDLLTYAGNLENTKNLESLNNYTFVKGDICSEGLVSELFEKHQINGVIHLAAESHVDRSIEDPITTNDVNIGGFLNMLVATRDNKVQRFVYAASSSTYGDSENLPKVENIIGKPLSPYAITKYVNELYADNFKRAYNIDTIGLRYFNVYGRKQDPHGAYAAVIPLFVKQLMKHESPVINGDGSYSRDFTYIDNIIQMNVLAITSQNSEALNQVYNTAVGDRTTLVE